MQEKRVHVSDEELKYKKRSSAKGRPRSKHKHTYETVLLTYNHTYGSDKSRVVSITIPTKVCIVCGRVDRVNNDESYYVYNPVEDVPFISHRKDLSDKALNLPKWHTDDGKVAMRY